MRTPTKKLVGLSLLGLLLGSLVVLGGLGPPLKATRGGSYQKKTQQSPEVRPVFDAQNFRTIFIGDSQIAGPTGSRIRVWMRNWDFPIGGAFVGAHFIWAGQEVLYNVDLIPQMSSRELTSSTSWSGGGDADFGCLRGYEWRCLGDVESPETPIGSYKLYLRYPNLHPWNEDWVSGRDILVRIAVRTTPISIPVIETRATRGNFTDKSTRTTHLIQRQHGYQILEQVVPAGFMSGVDGTGVSFYLPEGVQELSGEVFQVLGVSLLPLGDDGRPVRGMIIGANAYPGWRISNHLALSSASRRALIELVDANSIMVMLGHNREDAAGPGYRENYSSLLGQWNQSFDLLGRNRPVVIGIAPWMINGAWAPQYLAEVEDTMRVTARETGGLFFSYLSFFNQQIPDDFDPKLYQLDSIRVHPGNDATAVRLSEDLESMFQGWIQDHQ